MLQPCRFIPSPASDGVRELQYYILTRPECTPIRTIEDERYQCVLKKALFGFDINSTTTSVLNPVRTRPFPTTPRHKFGASSLEIFLDSPDISTDPRHQPFTTIARDYFAVVLSSHHLYFSKLVDNRTTYVSVNLSDCGSISSIEGQAAGNSIFLGTDTGKLFSYDVPSFHKTCYARLQNPLGPITQITPHILSFIDQTGTVHLLDTRDLSHNILYSSHSSFNSFSFAANEQYVGFCNENFLSLMDIRQTRAPLLKIDQTFDKVAFNAGRLIAAYQDNLVLISPSSLKKRTIHNPGSFESLHSISPGSLATTRLYKGTTYTELLSLSNETLIIDRVVNESSNLISQVVHTRNIGEQLLNVYTSNEFIGIWNTPRRKEKKRSAPIPFNDQFTIR